jgi:hypothetical protein
MVKSSLKFLNFFTLKNLNNKKILTYIIFITKKYVIIVKVTKLQILKLQPANVFIMKLIESSHFDIFSYS